ncbi:Type-2 restriction enzyme HpaII [Waddlia chondrophila 2032/99]|uniref:Type-2 restriction enzyme HpaII n=1 Tax=Waddlia chondrophila 2032/99 TaxID=765953 RepID=F8LBL9_9BACT|nr:Type-2 restriction enzyme HpaII [Waddlia chondrophila 2032/99]
MIKKANKGEWSEFYAFLKILFDHKLFSADETFTIIPESFLEVLSVIRNEDRDSLRYDIDEKKQVFNISKNDVFLTSVPFFRVGGKLDAILKQIQSGGSKTGSFAIPDAEELMDDLQCTKLKASSREKSDILVSVHDIKSATTQDRGFSIKSKLGGKSTLFNASGATNFLFKLVEGQQEKTPETKPRINLDEILDNKFTIQFVDIQNTKFKANLELVDSSMPELLSEVVKYYYLGYPPDIKTLTSILARKDPLKKQNPDFYRHKIQELLISIALGMQPTKKWSGDNSATGGYIIVKEDGELACYHIYERDRFKRYLFSNTMLDTPSRSRHKFGTVFHQNGDSFINLNLQIRFTN